MKKLVLLAWVFVCLGSSLYAQKLTPVDRDKGVKYLEQTRESVRSLETGDTNAAIEHMRRAADISVQSRMARETIAWTWFTLGDDSFQAGDLAGASRPGPHDPMGYRCGSSRWRARAPACARRRPTD